MNTKRILWGLVFACVLAGSGCATGGKKINRALAAYPRADAPESEAIPEVITKSDEGADSSGTDSEAEDSETLAMDWAEDLSDDAEADIAEWIDYFSKKEPERFERFLKRGSMYREVVQAILKEYGLPPELYYLAMIESGYANHAASFASAVGSWQFIKGTGKRYGLHIDHYVDERRDPIRATEAAAKYLRDLYEMFGDWPLAMAAYNCGEARVQRAIGKGRSKDFWRLSELRLLPPETRAYVPKFIAAARIGEYAEKYGFNTKADEKYPDVEAVELPSPIRLDTITRVAGVDYEILKQVNPHLRVGVTPPGRSTYEVWIPTDKADEVQKMYTRMGQYRLRGLRSLPLFEGNRHYHVVRSGESLAAIAKRYKVSVAFLKRINGIKGSRVASGTTLRIDARRFKREDVVRVIAGGTGKKQGRTPKVITYKVRPGDNLTEISRRFNVPIDLIKRQNGLKHPNVLAGQVLRIRVAGSVQTL